MHLSNATWENTKVTFKAFTLLVLCLFFLISCESLHSTKYPIWGRPLRGDISLLCLGCNKWEDIEKYYGKENALYLNLEQVKWGTIILSGDKYYPTKEYALVTSIMFNPRVSVPMLEVWNLTDNREATIQEAFDYEVFTIWSPESTSTKSDYIWTGYNKGLDSYTGKLWAKPSFKSVSDLLKKITTTKTP